MPRNDSVKWIQEGKNKFIRFQLRDKDYGGWVGDRTVRHNAPYWERAEVRQISGLDKNAKYELGFNVRFVKGFSGDRETFWQMHAFNSHCKKTSPPIMIKISQGGLLLAALKEGGGGHINHYTNLKINDLLGKWSLFKLKFDTSETPVVSLFVDDKEIISSVPYGIESCGTPHFKFGIYRPGRKTRDGGTKLSVIDFDKINLTVLDTDYERVFCLRKDTLISNSKIYPADKCEPGDKKLTSYQFNAISRFLKKGLSEDILRERVEWSLEHPYLESRWQINLRGWGDIK